MYILVDVVGSMTIADPHTANVLVRVSDSPVTLYDRLRSLFSLSPRPQIVLLDHGLYRQLDDKFRRFATRTLVFFNLLPTETIVACGEG